VTELSRAGAVERVLVGRNFHFTAPWDLAVVGTNLFVADLARAKGGSVTEADTGSGRLKAVLSGPKYRFDIPIAMTVDGRA
jgi:hypothetical protein